ncbi:MAG: hypothetical protein EPN23_06835 [Verrucomicrobia bacterium]|nr:MAG: hypothetical protein EPN23_06835 [Verrucomicrobiota bacterium]
MSKQYTKWALALLAVTGLQSALGEWYDDGKIKGDMRYRVENIQQEGSANRNRDRIRARIGYYPRVNSDVDVGISLGTDEAVNGLGDPISNNQTLGSQGTKKGIYVDTAYIDWHPSILPGVDLIGGKMKNPLITVNDYLVDNDYTPEGLALKYHVGDDIEFLANGSYQWIQERSADDDTKLYAGQAALNFKMANESHVTVGATYYGFQKMQGFGVQDWQNANKAYGNSTTKKISGTTTNLLYANEFKVVEGFAEAGTTIVLPVTVFGAYSKNSDPSDMNKAYTAGIKIGKASDPNTFELGYDYRYLDSDAFPGFLTDSDSFGGGTDGKGHKVSLTYQILKNWQAKVSYFIDKQKIESGETQNDYKRLQIDVIAKF